MGWIMILSALSLIILILILYFNYQQRKENSYIESNTEQDLDLIDRTREIAIATLSAHHYGWPLGKIEVSSQSIREVNNPKHGLFHLTRVENVKEYLLQRYMIGDRAYFSYAMQSIFANRDFSTRLLEDHEGMPLSPNLLRRYIYNIRCCMPIFKKYKIDMTSSDIKMILGFDMSELIIEVRYFLASGRLEERLALDFIHQAYSTTVAVSADWHELSKSYLLGLGMITGNSIRFKDAVKQFNRLHKNKRSIWNQIELIPK